MASTDCHSTAHQDAFGKRPNGPILRIQGRHVQWLQRDRSPERAWEMVRRIFTNKSSNSRDSNTSHDDSRLRSDVLPASWLQASRQLAMKIPD